MKYNLKFIGKAHPASMEVINEQPLASENVMEETQSLEVILGDLVSRVVFHIIQCLANPVILSLP
jgi:hypothetical protein